tara:strand:- start:818 stop:928 length:111 start_codon:yes stop_codon:yes gene_type:complete
MRNQFTIFININIKSLFLQSGGTAITDENNKDRSDI